MGGDGPRGKVRDRRRAAVVLTLLSVALVVTAPSVRATGSESAAATFESFELPTELIDTSMIGGTLEAARTAPKINVMLPPGYDDHPQRRYPVLWLLHGANGGTDTWIPGIAELAHGFPGIIVMPDGGLFGMYIDWWNGGARGGPAWATYHLQTLRHEIERRYRIRPERRWHAIGGISMGGQGALRYAAMLPGYFGSVATFSAAFPDIQSPLVEGGIGLLTLIDSTYGATYGDIYGRARGQYAKGNNPQTLASNLEHTRVYVTSGSGIPCLRDPINPSGLALDAITEVALHLQQAPFAHAARRAGADVTAVTTCGIHTHGVWDRAIPAAIDWGLFAEVPETPEHWTYRTIATSGEMWGLRFRFAEPSGAIVEFHRDGERLSATGTGEVAIDGPDGCRLRASLPFDGRLPSPCRRAS